MRSGPCLETLARISCVKGREGQGKAEQEGGIELWCGVLRTRQTWPREGGIENVVTVFRSAREVLGAEQQPDDGRHTTKKYGTVWRGQPQRLEGLFAFRRPVESRL